MQMDPSMCQSRAQLHHGDLLAEAERRRMAKIAIGGVPQHTFVSRTRTLVGAGLVRVGEWLQGTIPSMPAIPEGDVTTSVEPHTAG